MGHQIRQRGHPLPERWGVGQPREALPEPLVLGLHLGHALPEDVEGDRRRGPLPLASEFASTARRAGALLLPSQDGPADGTPPGVPRRAHAVGRDVRRGR
jgi:hypothetical protein